MKRYSVADPARAYPLSDFPGIPFEYAESLRSKRIRNSREFFEQVQTSVQQKEWSGATGIPEVRLKELFALCDLCRITGVEPVFARIIYEAGIRSTKEFADTDAAGQHQKYLDIIEKYGYDAEHFVEEDIQYCIDYANVILEIEEKSKQE